MTESNLYQQKKILHHKNNKSWIIVIPHDGATRSLGKKIIESFSNLKVNYEVFDIKQYYLGLTNLFSKPDNDIIVDIINNALIVKSLEVSATHVLVLALAPITVFSLKLLKKQNISTFHWFYEDFRRATYWSSIIEYYDHFAAIQKGVLEKTCKDLNTKYHFLQTAVSINRVASNKISPIVDVSFIGILSDYRISVLEYLLNNGITLAIAGTGWNQYYGILKKSIVFGEWVSVEQNALILSKAKIGLNLSVNDPYDNQNNPQDTQISPRVYDILYAESNLLTEDVPLAQTVLEEFYYEKFTTRENLLNKVKELSVKFETTETLRKKNKRIVTEKHTFDQRVKTILKLTDGK